MEENTSGASGAQGGAEGDPGVEPQKKEKTVSLDDHRRAIDDLHKYKSKVKEYEKRIGDVEAKALKEKEDWKTLYERTALEKQEIEERERQVWNSFETEKKYSAVEAIARKAGIKDVRDLGLLPLDGVQIEKTDTGRVIVHGAEACVEELKKTRPHWFKSQEAPRVNGSSGTTQVLSEEKMTPAKLVELEKKYRNDPKKLKELYEIFQKQRLSDRH